MQQGSIISKNYAKALFKVCKAQNKLEETENNFKKFIDNFSDQFFLELKNPAISKKDLVEIVNQISQKLNISGIFADFLSVVAENRRISLIKQINQEFIKLVKIENNILEVEIISANKLSSSQEDEVKKIIANKYQDKKIEIITDVKVNILGGLQIKIGSNLIDASLKNSLFNLRQDLINAIN